MVTLAELMDVTYYGFAAPVGPSWSLINGSRGHRRDQTVKIDHGVLHLWVSPEDGPERYLKHLRTPELPLPNSRTFQSKAGNGMWLWEDPDGKPTISETRAKRFVGKNCTVYRYGQAPYSLISGISPMPWCYGAGYPCVLGIDSKFYFAANPDEIACNHAPPFNERSVGAVMPGRYQTDAQWMDPTSLGEITAFAKLMVYCWFRWGIPIKHVDKAGLLRGEHGWSGHVDINDAYKKSDHGDPGRNFPWEYAIKLAYQILEEILNMARAVNVYDFSVPGWIASPELFAMVGPTLEWVQSIPQMNRLYETGALTNDPMTGKPGGIFRSDLQYYRREGEVWPETPFLDSEWLDVDRPGPHPIVEPS